MVIFNINVEFKRINLYIKYYNENINLYKIAYNYNLKNM